MNILYAIFEAAPFAKTGGLGDVGGTLPAFLNESGHDVRLIMPKHDAIPEKYRSKMKHLFHFHMQLGWRTVYYGLEMLKYKGVTCYFIDNEAYFKRTSLYGYADDAERVAFFCKAALECLTHLERFKPQIIHCNDWHASLIPVMLREYFGNHPYYYDIKSVITIHNLKFQGIISRYYLGDLLGMERHVAARECLDWEDGGAINFLKGAFHYADAITTVSPTYAKEIRMPYYGEKLDGVLRWREEALSGILNGIDYSLYDPSLDKLIFRMYRARDWEGKAHNKKSLQAELGLPAEADKPLLIIISRFTEQKGLDLIAHVMEELLWDGAVQMAVLGTGDWRYEEMFYYFAERYPDRIAARITFDDMLAHKMYAGGDILLMPSRFEPCGIAQMIAMKYGTLPLVRETGGLRDTVTPYDEDTGEGTGFSFANYNAHELLFTIRSAVALYQNEPEKWRLLQSGAMDADFSWQASAKKYARLYDSLCKKPRQTKKKTE
ncbi:MAG: glycogen synthase GlgA [Clostridiales Family XIII bacterium]|jgi:starch synthase|nr:glycogen synthase GlgA [Clostridiales Family XIII bacterium]